MRVLLDTHAFLWWINDDARMSERARYVFSDGNNELLLSAASSWEMALKIRLGNLRVSGDLGPYISTRLAENAMEMLPITLGHTVGVAELPLHHRDPFDRLLVAQALAEELPIVSADPQLARYPVEVLW